jgi:P-type E1-E2 ATPase
LVVFESFQVVDNLEHNLSPEIPGFPIKVIRDGEHQIIDSKSIVVGDIVYVESGDTVPADGLIIKANGIFHMFPCQPKGLIIDESMLTGESMTPQKYENEVLQSETVVQEGSGNTKV